MGRSKCCEFARVIKNNKMREAIKRTDRGNFIVYEISLE